MNRWTRRKVIDAGRTWCDWECGVWRAAEGYDEPSRLEGRPWTLFCRGRWVSSHATLGDARRAAAEASR